MSEKVQEQKEKPVHHEVGDLTIKCGHCGNVELLQKDIPGGISFILGTIENAEVKMKCGKCNTEMILTFTGMSDERDVEFRETKKAMEETVKEQEQQAAKAAELAKVKEMKLTPEQEKELIKSAEGFEEFKESESDAVIGGTEEGEEVDLTGTEPVDAESAEAIEEAKAA